MLRAVFRAAVIAWVIGVSPFAARMCAADVQPVMVEAPAEVTPALDPGANAALDWWRAFEFLPKEDSAIFKLSLKCPLPNPEADSYFTVKVKSLNLLAFGSTNSYCDWGIDIAHEGIDVASPYTDKMRVLIRLGLLRARWHAQRGEASAAVDDLLVCLRASRLFSSHHPLLIDSLAGIGIVNMSIAVSGAVAPKLDAIERRRFQAAITRFSLAAVLENALDQEVAMTASIINRIRSMPLAERTKMAQSFGTISDGVMNSPGLLENSLTDDDPPPVFRTPR